MRMFRKEDRCYLGLSLFPRLKFGGYKMIDVLNGLNFNQRCVHTVGENTKRI